jgi:hypothetical protein
MEEDCFDLCKVAVNCLDDDLKRICESMADSSIFQLQTLLLIQNTRLLRKIRKYNKHNPYKQKGE